MKKSIFIFFLLISFFDVEAATTVVDNNYVEMKQEVIEYTDDSIDIMITIPIGITSNSIKINSSVLDMINHFGLLNKKNKTLKVNLIINNETGINYSYRKDSLIIYPNYTNFNYLYRTKNKAIKALFKKGKVYLDDIHLEKKLIYNGYNGISELDKYYLDYYNKKYKTKYLNINSFNNKIKKDIFKYTKSTTLETNDNIRKLSYDYYNSKILKLIFNNNYYSIEECMEYYVDDSEFKNSLNNIGKINNVSFYVKLDKDYNPLFKNYLSGGVSFVLEKVNA